MAEVILPPEELEPELPEEQLPEVEKPTEKSKVISVNFSPLNTKQTANLDTRGSFFTTDTDAWIVLKIDDMSEPTGQYSLALMNKQDGSIFQRTGDIVNGVAYYKLLPNEIKHAGRWFGQAVITLPNGQTTASRFIFTVSGHILDGKDVREIVIQDFQTLMKQLNDLKDNEANEFGLLKSEIEDFQTIAQKNENERKSAELERVAAEKSREENYESKVDAAIVEADVVEKVDNKVAELSPAIQEVTAQLAQTQKELEIETARNLLSDQQLRAYVELLQQQLSSMGDISPKPYATYEDLVATNPPHSGVYVVQSDGNWYYWNSVSLKWTIGGQFQSAGLADGIVKREKIAKGAVTYDKTTFLTVGENLYNKRDAHTPNKVIIPTTGEESEAVGKILSNFIPIDPSKGTIYLSERYFSHYLHAFFDGSYIPIPTNPSDNGTNNTKQIPPNAGYIKVTLSDSSKMESAMLVYGSYPNNILLNYKPYELHLNNVKSDYKDIQNVKVEARDTSFVELINEQLFDKNQTFTRGAISTTSGSISDHATRVVSDYIPIDPSKGTIYLSAQYFSHYLHAFSDKNKIHIPTNPTDNGTNNTKQIPENAAYIRVTLKDGTQSNLNNAVLVYGSHPDNTLLPPIPYGQKITNLTIESQKYSGKKGVIMGDSLVDASKYHHYIAQKTGLEMINCGFGGTRAAEYTTTVNGKFSFYKLVDAILSGDYSEQEAVADEAGLTRLPTLKAIDWNDVDFVFLAYGTNDFTSNSGIGDGKNMNVVNYDGALNYGIDKMLTNYPHLKFILISPLFRNRWSSDEPTANSDIRPNSAGVWLRDYVEAMEKVSNNMHIPFINAYDNSGINKYNQHIYFVDGLHFKVENSGYNDANEYFGSFVAQQFKMYY